MTPPAGLIDFFIREASDYLDRLRALLAAAMSGGQPGVPDGDAFASTARALRGAATMARLDALASLAATLERVGRETAARRVQWDVELHSAVASALDDVRELLPATRQWSGAHEPRLRSRADDLLRRLPADAVAPTPPRGTPAPSPAFLASELESIASALAQQAGTVAHASGLAEAAARARALRGVAGLDELPPLGDVIDAVERATAAAAPHDADASGAMLDAAARLLARAASDLREGRRPHATSPEARAFASALESKRDAESAPDAARVVPIESLFYADAGPHVVERAAQPGPTRDDRFHAELVAHTEHLRRLLANARGAADPIARARVADELRRAARATARVASSYGAAEVAELFDGVARDPEPLAPASLDLLDAAAAVLAEEDVTPESAGHAMRELGRGRSSADALARAFAPLGAAVGESPRAATPVAAARTQPATPAAPSRPTPGASRAIRRTPSRRTPISGPRQPTPTGRELHDLLSHGIAGFDALEQEPLSPPAPLDDLEVVPIEALLYRGRAALERALELRDQIRSRGTPHDAALVELFDLLDLATAE